MTVQIRGSRQEKASWPDQDVWPMQLKQSLVGHSEIDTGAAHRSHDVLEGKARLHLRLLGQMAATDRRGAVQLPKGRKSRALLAILALSLPRPVLREQVTALLWSRREREQARASLRQCIHELHSLDAVVGGSMVRSEGQTLVLDASLVSIDVHEVVSAGPSDPRALDLLQSPLLEDLGGLDPAFDDWLAAETRRMRHAASVLAGLILEQQREPGDVIVAARRLVTITPTHEAGWRRLMQAYADSGEREAAIEAYEGCALALKQAVHAHGTETPDIPPTRGRPSEETNSLLSRICEASPEEPSRRVRLADPAGLRSVWLGVVPFRTSDPADEATLSLGLAEEITTALARFRWINLISPSSFGPSLQNSLTAPLRGGPPDVDFLLDGAVQRGGSGRCRITIRLLDLRVGGEVVWSARFDHEAIDGFALQDEVAASTAAQVEPQLMVHESRRAASLPIRSLNPYELMLLAVPQIYRLLRPGFHEAGALLAEASERAPDSATILGWSAIWHAFLVGQGWSDNPEATMRIAGELAGKAIALDPGCARALSVAAYVRSFLLHQDINVTIGLHERALALNPNMAFGWAVSALSHSYAGEHRTAVLHGKQARLLSPFDPQGFFFDSALMVPHLMLGDYEVVAKLGRQSIAMNPALSATHKGLLAALGHLGRKTEADEVLARLLLLEPGFSLKAAAVRSPLRRSQDLAIYIEGLRAAGLPPT